MKIKYSKIWWGPPKKFSTEFEERKISWLELFYDLVYVIAISKITHHLAEHLRLSGLLEYIYFFAMIFWGWLNGSLHHDIHGSPGLRTSLMTLWQMMIVAALAITLDSNPEDLVYHATLVLMVMQLFITYLWWSVGIYDKAHRKLNRPYTIMYLVSFALMFLTLFLEQPYVRIVFYLTLALNYAPPFVVHKILKRGTLDFSLSSSMTERLGLFTIIIFGEAVLGVVSGVSGLKELNTIIWIEFGLAILIVFSLWWLFFTLVSDRPCKKGFLKSSLMEILYIPTLMALGMIGVVFSKLFKNFAHDDPYSNWIKIAFGLSLSVFLMGINLLLNFLEYPSIYNNFKKRMQRILSVAIAVFLLLVCVNLQLSLFGCLLIVWIILIVTIMGINLSYYVLKRKNSATEA